MRAVALLALALSGCGYAAPDGFVISAELSPEQQEATVNALESWFELAPELRVPYAIHDAPALSESYIREEECDNLEDHHGLTHLRPVRAPGIIVCRGVSIDGWPVVIAHEIGHALAAREDHASEGVMLPRPRRDDVFLGRADRLYVMGVE